MDEVELTSENAVSPRKYIKGNAQEELKRRAAESIDNFDGPRITVFLDVPYTTVAMNIIADRVGKNAEVLQYDSKSCHCLIRINVRRSPTLIGWLLQNVGFFSVVSPQFVIDDILEMASSNMKVYKQSI